MIKIKLEKNKRNEPIFKLGIKENEIEKYRFLKRALMESKNIKGRYNYQIPIRFFEPIIQNLSKEDILVDKNSLDKYLVFSDDYDENFYYKIEADARYMKRWREEGCPHIYKVNLNKENNSIIKEVAFKRLGSLL